MPELPVSEMERAETEREESMKGRKEEAEIIVRIDQLAGIANICVSSWPSMARKMLKLYGHALQKSGQQAHYWTLPMKSVSFRRPVAAGKPRRMPVGGFKRKNKGQSEDLFNVGGTLHVPRDTDARKEGQ